MPDEISVAFKGFILQIFSPCWWNASKKTAYRSLPCLS